jgi:flavodoxin
MSKSRIVYATKTRHSKKLAQAIGTALNIPAENVSDNLLSGEADLLFLVGGIYGGESLPELLAFVKSLDREKIKSVVLITSCASKKQGQDTVRKILQDKEISVADEFICQGSFLFFKIGHPNKADIQEVVAFAVKMSELIQQLL